MSWLGCNNSSYSRHRAMAVDRAWVCRNQPRALAQAQVQQLAVVGGDSLMHPAEPWELLPERCSPAHRDTVYTVCGTPHRGYSQDYLGNIHNLNNHIADVDDADLLLQDVPVFPLPHSPTAIQLADHCTPQLRFLAAHGVPAKAQRFLELLVLAGLDERGSSGRMLVVVVSLRMATVGNDAVRKDQAQPVLVEGTDERMDPPWWKRKGGLRETKVGETLNIKNHYETKPCPFWPGPKLQIIFILA